MNEIRKDSLIDRYVIIASKRSKRPDSYNKYCEKPDEKVCYFCQSNEHLTPPEIDRIEKGGRWIVRCFPNKFPATSEGKARRMKGGSMPAVGKHEIIVETPEHEGKLHQLSTEHMMKVFDMYNRRVEAIGRMSGVRYVSLFKNYGKDAGASLYHTHTQIIGVPIVPGLVTEEINASKGRCRICDIGRQELRGRRRIRSDENVIAFAPYASRFPFEACLQPKRHITRLSEMSESETRSFAKTLQFILKRLDELMDCAPYNFYLHQSPKGGNLHLHLELIPKMSILAGFELGSGMYINTMPPEEAARYYRTGRI
ncbi:MAG: DUF4931 domain-containing protein [Candidatus Altiarchaeota archaeon]